MLGQYGEVVSLDLMADQLIGGDKAQDIHEAVPADLEGAKVEEDRVDLRIRKHDGRHKVRRYKGKTGQ